VQSEDTASGDGFDGGGGGEVGSVEKEGTEEADYVVITLPVRKAFAVVAYWL
jgi:hypothetical protein